MHPRFPSLAPRVRVRLQFPESQLDSLLLCSGRDPWSLHLSPSPISMTAPGFPLPTFSLCPPCPLGPNEERGEKLHTPSKARRGSSGRGGARCPSLGASEGHNVARQPLLPLPPLRGLEPRPLCQGLRNSGWQQGPQPISFPLHLSKGTL